MASSQTLTASRWGRTLSAIAVALAFLGLVFALSPSEQGLGLQRIDPRAGEVISPGYPYYLPNRAEAVDEKIPLSDYQDRYFGGNLQLHLGAGFDREALEGIAFVLPAVDGDPTLFYNGTTRGTGAHHAFGGAGFARQYLVAWQDRRGGLNASNWVDVIIEKEATGPVRLSGRPVFTAPARTAPAIATQLPAWGQLLRTILLAAAATGGFSLLILLPMRRYRMLGVGVATCLPLAIVPLLRGDVLGWDDTPLLLAAAAAIGGAALAWRQAGKLGPWLHVLARAALALAVIGAVATGLFCLAPGAIPFDWFRMATLASLGVAPLLLLVAPILAFAGMRQLVTELGLLADEADRASAIIAEQDEKLHAQLRANAVMEERQRFVRDMHDGVGGQLLSLLARLRARRIDLDEVESEVESGLNDLRLVVDALDRTGATLEEALSMFEVRARQQLSAAGIALEWHEAGQPDYEASDTRRILGIYRLMQEATANIIRHSGAATATVHVRSSATSDGGAITIADDGRGFDPRANARGRGLANMEERARRMGGKLSIETQPGGGTKVTLFFPPAGE
ncbi:sensor histidine kinase [Paraurantiacibacter namhicola]|uniref:histidine kinase n=1 Tax=Paraurantiacibacter namhicola TaxID=645517 RepID=A0A1C7D7V2_9SPHN|nr:ATP-binding protein [Paraurantiacibacter namhicola]ANU07432.1 Sensor histidine kinase DesK [Paraurantiacibacter namhicola]